MQPVSEEAGEHGRSTVKAWCFGSRWSERGLALSLSPRQIHPTPSRLRVKGRGGGCDGIRQSLTSMHIKHCNR